MSTPVTAPMTAAALKPSNDSRPAGIDAAEWDLRVQLAAAYRIFDHIGWIELIFNHITVRVPGPEKHVLINPYGLMYSEVTASNLVKIDLDGNVVGPSNFPVNPAGYIIHSAIHAARDDAHCIMHTHTTTGMAVACKAEGLSPTNFYSAIIGDQVAYHDFEGTTTNPDERPRLVASIGEKNYVILRNHGLLSCGRTIPEAFSRLWTLQRACDVQVAATSIPGETIHYDEAIVEQSRKAMADYSDSTTSGNDVFNAMQRIVDAKDPSYRS